MRAIEWHDACAPPQRLGCSLHCLSEDVVQQRADHLWSASVRETGVVVAAGLASRPQMPTIVGLSNARRFKPGKDLDGFAGSGIENHPCRRREAEVWVEVWVD